LGDLARFALRAITSFDEGRGVSHQQVKDWVNSWNGKKGDRGQDARKPSPSTP